MKRTAITAPERGKSIRRLLLVWLAIFVVAVAAVCEGIVWPQASGDKVASKGGTEIDYSHAEDGYMMIRQKAGNKRYKLRIEKDAQTYTYDLNSDGAWEVFPLQLGTGSYAVKVFKQASGNKYSSVSSQKIKVSAFNDENACFLCPNHVLALTVPSGYLPELDNVISKKMGICFDYASLAAAMLRVQGVPTKLVIGYADSSYHSWNEVYVNGQWMRLDITAQVTNMNVKSYTTERIY